MPDSDALKAEIWDFFLHGLALGERLALYDGIGGRGFFASRSRTTHASRRSGSGRRPSAARRRTSRERSTRSPTWAIRPYPTGSTFPDLRTSRAIADGRREPAARGHVGIASVRSRTRFQLPARRRRTLSAHRRACRGAAVGQPLRHEGARTALDGVVVHMCLQSGEEGLTTYQKDELRRFWSLYVHWLGRTARDLHREPLPAASTAGAERRPGAFRGNPGHFERGAGDATRDAKPARRHGGADPRPSA